MPYGVSFRPVDLGSDSHMHRFQSVLALVLLAMSSAQGAWGDVSGGLEPMVLPAIDPEKVLSADERRVAIGQQPHFAATIDVKIDPFGDSGIWDVAGPGGMGRWRLRLVSRGALSLNLAFTRFRMPAGGSLELISADGRRIGPWTALDNESHGELWTPPMPTDDLVIELRLPIDQVDELELELTRVHHGYAAFGETGPQSGACHRDVACSEAEPWEDPSRSVALLSVEGRTFCTGSLVNNTALDGRPFIITANHCGITSRNAASVVVLWNHQNTGCVDRDEPSDSEQQEIFDFQTGAIWRAAHRPTDTLLLELDDSPAAFGVFYAGWDRSSADPERSAVIHHPSADYKSISLDFDRSSTTLHLGSDPLEVADQGSHIRIANWDMGSTEGGSSGAPLFNEDQRVVGVLHGGYAACGDSRADWFGRFSEAWTGNGRAGARLSDWLDPLATGAMTLDGLDGSSIARPFR